MNKLSGGNIQIFVAGALAVRGAQSLIAVPYLFFAVKGVGSDTLTLSMGLPLLFALSLPLGIGLLLDRPRIFGWAQVYLLLEAATSIGLLLLSVFYHSNAHPRTPIWGNFLDLPIPFILFGLLAWSRSRARTRE